MDDQRDYAEEAANRDLLLEEDEMPEILVSDIPEMPDYFGDSTKYGVELVYVPIVGAILKKDGKEYEIMKVNTFQENMSDGVEIVHHMKCLAIDADGNDAGEETITLTSYDEGITVA